MLTLVEYPVQILLRAIGEFVLLTDQGDFFVIEPELIEFVLEVGPDFDSLLCLLQNVANFVIFLFFQVHNFICQLHLFLKIFDFVFR